MRFERLTSAEHPMYGEAMALYRASFPFHEQREAVSQASILGDAEYRFNLICDDGTFVGLMLCRETPVFIYVEHFCILPDMRGKSYGTKALALLNERGKKVILEIDPPVDEVSLCRRAFYERAGYRANPYPHDHPAYHAGYRAHRLVVMSCPRPLSGAEYEAFARYLNTVVMGNR